MTVLPDKYQTSDEGITRQISNVNKDITVK